MKTEAFGVISIPDVQQAFGGVCNPAFAVAPDIPSRLLNIVKAIIGNPIVEVLTAYDGSSGEEVRKFDSTFSICPQGIYALIRKPLSDQNNPAPCFVPWMEIESVRHAWGKGHFIDINLKGKIRNLPLSVTLLSEADGWEVCRGIRFLAEKVIGIMDCEERWTQTGRLGEQSRWTIPGFSLFEMPLFRVGI